MMVDIPIVYAQFIGGLTGISLCVVLYLHFVRNNPPQLKWPMTHIELAIVWFSSSLFPALLFLLFNHELLFWLTTIGQIGGTIMLVISILIVVKLHPTNNDIQAMYDSGAHDELGPEQED